MEDPSRQLYLLRFVKSSMGLLSSSPKGRQMHSLRELVLLGYLHPLIIKIQSFRKFSKNLGIRRVACCSPLYLSSGWSLVGSLGNPAPETNPSKDVPKIRTPNTLSSGPIPPPSATVSYVHNHGRLMCLELIVKYLKVRSKRQWIICSKARIPVVNVCVLKRIVIAKRLLGTPRNIIFLWSEYILHIHIWYIQD